MSLSSPRDEVALESECQKYDRAESLPVDRCTEAGLGRPSGIQENFRYLLIKSRHVTALAFVEHEDFALAPSGYNWIENH